MESIVPIERSVGPRLHQWPYNALIFVNYNVVWKHVLYLHLDNGNLEDTKLGNHEQSTTCKSRHID